jgi:hypothetical protein
MIEFVSRSQRTLIGYNGISVDESGVKESNRVGVVLEGRELVN